MHQCFLLLGSNVGDRIRWLAFARHVIERNVGHILSMSHLYVSEPWGNPDQDAFLNQALIVSTCLLPGAVRERTALIEEVAGRDRSLHWGPRTLDIDILFYDDLVIETPQLVIPHRAFHQRNFALIPVKEVAPDYIHPVLQLSVTELASRSGDHGEVAIFPA